MILKTKEELKAMKAVTFFVLLRTYHQKRTERKVMPH